MKDIYQSSLDAKFATVMSVISVERGFGVDLTALNPTRLESVQAAAEQAIFEWASKRSTGPHGARPMTNLQHLLDEYCAIADHL